MKLTNQTVDNKKDPNLQLLETLIEECFTENTTHSDAHIEEEDAPINDTQFCPRTFDGFACWDETPAATTAYQPCPDFIIGFDPRRFAFKSCLDDGTWFRHPEVNKPWTNYTTCIDFEDLNFRSAVNNIYVVGYAISVAALLISVAIFLYFRALQCTRITIHVHLFTSFALNNLLWIVWYKAVIDQVTVVQNNEPWCQALHIITNYFMVTSYIWMFCEGLHLHIALVVVFVKEKVALKWFVATGWGLPVLIVGTYAAVRYHIPGATVRCWMDVSDSFWIIIVPVMASLFASFVFLVNVVRVLLTKLQPTPNQNMSVTARKAARATLILIPLFGLHFILIPLVPSPNSPGERFYQVFSALLTSLQGLCVAVLFCFTNQDVVIVIRAHFARYFKRDEGIPMAGKTILEKYLYKYHCRRKPNEHA